MLEHHEARGLLESPSSRRAWIEIQPAGPCRILPGRSPSSRRAWIEITYPSALRRRAYVALLAEGVDRNCKVKDIGMMLNVALLAEGVDRNRPTA